MEHSKAGNGKDLQERQEVTTFILWHMWKARNALYFCGENWEERVLIAQACEEWREWKEVQQENKNTVMARVLESRQKCWDKPEKGVIKLNVGSES